MKLLALLVCGLALAPAFADEKKAEKPATKKAEADDADTHPLTDMPEASPDVVIGGVFPKLTDNKMPLGEPIDALIGFVNEGQETMNVTYVMGSINSPFDSNYYIQNFTKRDYNKMVHEDEEFTFRYRFQPMDTLDPVEYKLALTIFYENEEELFSTTFFNGTATFYQPSSAFELGEIVKLGGGLAGILAVLYMVTQGMGGASSSTRSSGGDDDWTAGYDEGTSNKTVVRRRKKSSGKKKKN